MISNSITSSPNKTHTIKLCADYTVGYTVFLNGQTYNVSYGSDINVEVSGSTTMVVRIETSSGEPGFRSGNYVNALTVHYSSSYRVYVFHIPNQEEVVELYCSD